MDETLDALRKQILNATEGRDTNDPFAMAEAFLAVFPDDAEDGVEEIGRQIIEVNRFLNEERGLMNSTTPTTTSGRSPRLYYFEKGNGLLTAKILASSTDEALERWQKLCPAAIDIDSERNTGSEDYDPTSIISWYGRGDGSWQGEKGEYFAVSWDYWIVQWFDIKSQECPVCEAHMGEYEDRCPREAEHDEGFLDDINEEDEEDDD